MRILFFAILIFVGLNCAQAQSHYLSIDSLGYFKLIDFNGKQKTNYKNFQDVFAFSLNQIYFAKEYNKFGLVDSNLNYLIYPKYDTIYQANQYIFAEKFGALHVYDLNYKLYKEFNNFERVDFETINFEGEVPDIGKVIPSNFVPYILRTYENVQLLKGDLSFDEKFIFDDAFYLNGVIYVRKGNQFGFVSMNGKLVEPIYKSFGEFSYDVVQFKDVNNHWNYFLKDGRQIPDSDSTLRVDLKGDYFKIYKNGKGHLYNRELKEQIIYQGDDIFCLSNQIFKQIWVNNQIVDNKNYREYFAVKRNQKIGVIDKSNRQIIPCKYDHISMVNKDYFIVMINDKFGVINSTDEIIIPTTYTYIEISDHSSQYFRLYDGNKIGVANTEGKILVPCEFDQVDFSASGFLVRSKSNFGFYNQDGKMIVSPAYPIVYNAHPFLEFKNNQYKFLVGKNGLYTPLDCDKIQYSMNTIKYYRGNEIVIINLQNMVKQDSVIYRRNNEIEVEFKDVRYHISSYSPSCDLFQSQKNGLIGSIYKTKTSFAVYPVFDVLRGATRVYGINHIEKTINYDGIEIQTKETLTGFSASTGTVYNKNYLAVSDNLVDISSSIFSSAYNSAVNEKSIFNWESRNYEFNFTPRIILPPTRFCAAHFSAGEFSFENGYPILRFKDYFNAMNEFKNFQVNDLATFSLLSSSPMIYVKDPVWNYALRKDMSKNDYYTYFSMQYVEVVETGFVLFSKDNKKYGVQTMYGETIIPESYDKIISCEMDGKQFFIVQSFIENFDGTVDLNPKFGICNFEGKFVIEELFDEVKPMHSGCFLVKKNNSQFVIDENGNKIYSMNF